MNRASFGRQVRRLRMKRGLSLEKLSEATGLSRSQLSRIELGQQSVSVEKAGALATALDSRLHVLCRPDDGAVAA